MTTNPTLDLHKNDDLSNHRPVGGPHDVPGRPSRGQSLLPRWHLKEVQKERVTNDLLLLTGDITVTPKNSGSLLTSFKSFIKCNYYDIHYVKNRELELLS